jgi:hypothetical protein
MPNQRYKPEQIVNLLRKIEVEIANGKATPQAAREVAFPCVGSTLTTNGLPVDVLSRGSVCIVGNSEVSHAERSQGYLARNLLSSLT